MLLCLGSVETWRVVFIFRYTSCPFIPATYIGHRLIPHGSTVQIQSQDAT